MILAEQKKWRIFRIDYSLCLLNCLKKIILRSFPNLLLVAYNLTELLHWLHTFFLLEIIRWLSGYVLEQSEHQ